MRRAAIAARPDISERCADNVRNLLASQVPRAAVERVLAKAARAADNTDRCYCCGQLGHRRPDCSRRNENCSLCGKCGHWSQMCRSSGANANARAVEVEPDEPEEECREIQHVWALSASNNFDIPSDESRNLLNMIMDSGAEEHVVSLADWRSLGEPLSKPAQVRLRSATGNDMGGLWQFCGAWMVR